VFVLGGYAPPPPPPPPLKLLVIDVISPLRCGEKRRVTEFELTDLKGTKPAVEKSAELIIFILCAKARGAGEMKSGNGGEERER
jgi:hypothetical protein